MQEEVEQSSEEEHETKVPHDDIAIAHLEVVGGGKQPEYHEDTATQPQKSE